MSALDGLSVQVGLVAACRAMRIHRSVVYRDRARRCQLDATAVPARPRPRPRPPLAFSELERARLLECLYSERFMDCAPRSVYATLLDEGQYLGSVRTMYRALEVQAQSGERRNQLTHPLYAKPELLAVQPGEVWSWDITKLRGPEKWTVYHLYVILDIFSCYIVGWMIAPCESAALARQLIGETVNKYGIAPAPGTLTLHADRGSSIRSKDVAQLLVDLEVAKSHSRPYVSDDNPYSEAQFRTLKYRPEFPDRFGRESKMRARTVRASSSGTTSSIATAASAS